MHWGRGLAGMRPWVARARGWGQGVAVDQDVRDVVGVVHERDREAVEVRVIRWGDDIGHDGGDVSDAAQPGGAGLLRRYVDTAWARNVRHIVAGTAEQRHGDALTMCQRVQPKDQDADSPQASGGAVVNGRDTHNPRGEGDMEVPGCAKLLEEAVGCWVAHVLEPDGNREVRCARLVLQP